MEQDERLLHASSFGAAASAYAEHRPDYAQAAVRWALDEPAPGLRVLDLGAGTGKLTATLVAVGTDVIAVEPDLAMLTELRGALPDVRALPGSAEATLATRAGMLVMPEQEQEVVLGRIRAFLASKPETADCEFTLPMLTCVLRVRRL